MKYRITSGSNRCDGSPIFRIYRVEGTSQYYLDAASTLDKARAAVNRLMNTEPEKIVEEIEA